MRRLTLALTTLFALTSFGLALKTHANRSTVYETGTIVYAQKPSTSQKGQVASASTTTKATATGAQTTSGQKSTAAPNCSVATARAATAPAVGPSSVGLVVTPVAVDYYTVYGNSLNEIGRQINQCSPVRENNDTYSASTATSFSWAVQYSRDAGDICTVTQASVGLGVLLTYPVWQSAAATPSTTKAAWQNFITHLQEHENGHVDRAKKTAEAMLAHLQNFAPTSCSSLDAALRSQVQADIANLNQANEVYDAQTNHGVTQGAIL